MKPLSEKVLLVVDWALSKKDLRTVERFEDRVGLSGGTISKLRRGLRNDVTAINIAKILQTFPEISADWMMRDDEQYPMFGNSESVCENADNISRNADSDIKKLIDERDFLRRQLEITSDALMLAQKMAAMKAGI